VYGIKRQTDHPLLLPLAQINLLKFFFSLIPQASKIPNDAHSESNATEHIAAA
jgi:hypothetical protein